MRILFSSLPAYGHLIPLVPMIEAAQRQGHEVALLNHRSMADVVPAVRLLAAGPSLEEMIAESGRLSGHDKAALNAASRVGDLVVTSRLKLGGEKAVALAREFAPDLVIADMGDYLGRYAASALGVPNVAHGNAPIPPEAQRRVMEAAADAQFGVRGVANEVPYAFLDPWPKSLLRPTDTYPCPRVGVRPEPYVGARGRPPAAPAGEPTRPNVLVTLGTFVDDLDLLAAVLDSLTPVDVDVVVAPQSDDDVAGLAVTDERVRFAGFVPIAELLRDVRATVSTGGAGTILATLSAGLPMVLVPTDLDRPDNAARVAAAGAGLVAEDPRDAGPAVQTALDEPRWRQGAQRLAAEIAGTNTPGAALRLVIDLRP